MRKEYPAFNFDQVDYVTSDTHFGHARISELASRPFASVSEMNAELIQRWNRSVAPTDVVLHLGDVALGTIIDSLPLTAQLNGRRFLVPGNHDRVSPATQSRAAIERFTPLYEQAGWTVLPEVIEGTRRGIRLLASHYPYSGDTQVQDRHTSRRPIDHGIPLLHGHTHDRWNGPVGHQFHVGIDAFEYAPIPFSMIDAWLEDLRREDDEIVGERTATGDETPPSEVAERFGIDLPPLETPGPDHRRGGHTLMDGDEVTSGPATAMDLVRRARDGEISGDELVAVLSTWQFEPQHRTRGLTDDWESLPNSFDAVQYAFNLDLLDEDAYRRIADRARRSEAAGRE